MLSHSIEFAKENDELIDKIVVSTDDEEIKKVALDLNVEVIDRPASLATDEASTASVLQHALRSQEESYDNVVLLQVTNPLRPKDLLDSALETFNGGTYDSLMTVTRNYQKFGKIKDDTFVPFNYEMGQRSQDLDPLYFENGLLYITRSELIKDGIILGTQNVPFIVDHPFANVDIDTLEDLEYAEFLLKKHTGI